MRVSHVFLFNSNSKHFFSCIQKSWNIIEYYGNEIENNADIIITKYTEENSKTKTNKGDSLSYMSLLSHS